MEWLVLYFRPLLFRGVLTSFFSLSLFPSSHFFPKYLFLHCCAVLQCISLRLSVSRLSRCCVFSFWAHHSCSSNIMERSDADETTLWVSNRRIRRIRLHHTHTHTRARSNLERKGSSFILIVWLCCTLHPNYGWDSKFFFKTGSSSVKNTGIKSFAWSSVLLTFIYFSADAIGSD